MIEPTDDQDKIRQLLKNQPTLTPPESFYQGVRRRIESRKSRPIFGWGIPVKAFATACVVMLVIFATREKPADGPIVSVGVGVLQKASNEYKKEAALKSDASPALGSLARENAPLDKVKITGEKERQEVSGLLARRLIAEAPKAKALEERDDIRLQARDMEGAASQSSFEGSQSLASKQYKGKLAESAKSKSSNAGRLSSQSIPTSVVTKDIPMQVEPTGPRRIAVAGGIAGAISPASTDELQRGDSMASVDQPRGSARLKDFALSGRSGALGYSGVETILPQWKRCEKTEQCVAVPESCSCRCDFFINKIHENEYRKRVLGPCNAIRVPACNRICPDVQPACVSGVCQALPK